MTSQFQVINKILQTGDNSIVTVNNLTEDHFFSYKSEFRYIQDHYKRHQTVPDRLTFVANFTEFDILDVTEPDSYLLEQLLRDYKASYIVSKVNEIRHCIERNDIEAASLLLADSVKGLQAGSTFTCVDLLRDTSRYDRYVERMENRSDFYISTGFPELDHMIGGIDVKEENMVIAARTGEGKTWTLIKMAAEAVRQGRRVGMYSGEMSEDKVGYRLDTILGHIDNNAITRGNNYDSSVPDRYKTYLSNLSNSSGTFKVLTPNHINGPATVGALQSFIERENLDILFIDQYSLLEDQHKAKVAHERIANISKDIKNLQVMFRIPIICVSQMNRTKNDDGQQDTTQIGLSDRIGQDATTIIMLSREKTYADEAKTRVADDKLILNVVKSRDGGSGKLIYKVDFNLGYFIYLDPNLTEEASEELREYYEEEEEEYTYSD
jgi:replicative DNA helicase